MDVKPILRPEHETQPKKPNKFTTFLKFVFVKNIGYKILALTLSVALWALSVGLAI